MSVLNSSMYHCLKQKYSLDTCMGIFLLAIFCQKSCIMKTKNHLRTEGREREMRNAVWASFWNIPLRKNWGEKSFFQAIHWQAKGLQKQTKVLLLVSYVMCSRMQTCVVFVDKLQQNHLHHWLIFCFKTASTVMGFWLIGEVGTVALCYHLPDIGTNTGII